MEKLFLGRFNRIDKRGDIDEIMHDFYISRVFRKGIKYSYDAGLDNVSLSPSYDPNADTQDNRDAARKGKDEKWYAMLNGDRREGDK